MSIEKTYFNVSTASVNAAELKAWLLENSELIDDITVDTAPDGSVRMRLYIGDFEFLNFVFSSSTNPSATLSAYTKKGAAISDGAHDSDVGKVQFAYKTSTGIMLYFNEKHVIMLSKTDADSAAVYARWQRRTQSGTYWIPADLSLMYDAENSAVIYADLVTNGVTTRDKTVLIPMLFHGGTTAPNMLQAFCMQYRGTAGVLSADGTKYATDGYVTLKE